MDTVEDNALFKKFGLIEKFNLELNCPANLFRQAFEENVSEKIDPWRNYGKFMQRHFGIKKQKEFTGEIQLETFVIWKSATYSDGIRAIARGNFMERDGRLVIEFSSFIEFQLVLFVAIPLLLIFTFSSFAIFQGPYSSQNPAPFIAGLAIMILLFAWRVVSRFRKSVKELRFNLEREFHFWMSK